MNHEECSSDIKVSVVMPVYNMADYMRSAIDSILESKLNDIEAVIIDDGSTDSSAAVISEYTNPSGPNYDERVRYAHQKNRGRAAALNHGIRISKGKYITILDADDLLPSDSLSLRYNALQSENTSANNVAIGGFEVLDDGNTVGARPAPSRTDPDTLHRRFYYSYKTPFHTNACLISRDLLERVGPFDEDLKRCQDIDFSLRLLKEARNLCTIQAPVYRYRKHREHMMDRLRIRTITFVNRPRAYAKNYSGWRKFAAIASGIILDAGKFLYEIKGNYYH